MKKVTLISLLLLLCWSSDASIQKDSILTNPYQSEFDQAYSQYPDIPRGLLEAVSFTNTRFRHITPFEQEGCSGIPKSLSLFGLTYDGKGYFRENLRFISQLSATPANDIIADPSISIDAYAKAYNALLDSFSLRGTAVEDQSIILVSLSEIPLDTNTVNDFALSAQLYSIYAFMNDADYQQAYGFPSWQIDMERIFGAANLQVLSAPMVGLNGSSIQTPTGGSYVPMMHRSPDYPPGIWNPAPTCNFSSRNGTAVSAITIHTIQGSYAGAISWSQNCSSNVSYHYVVRSADGQVTQMVYESDKGWHVGSANPYTIGYEHEGFVSDPSWYTTAMYNSSAAISRDVIQSGYGINPLRTYSGPATAGLNTLGGCTKIKGHQHYPNQTHTDPGINWDWERYYRLINDNPNVTTETASTGTFYDSGGPSGNYSDDEREVYTIAPAGATSISITFNQFDLEANWDYLYVYDGGDINAPLIGTFTGTTNPGTISGSGGSLTLEFRSDCATNNPGWEISWTSNSIPPVPQDTIPPISNIDAISNWVTQDFNVSFSDIDNPGGSGVEQGFISVIHFDGTEWRANTSNGYFSDNFDSAIHPDWTVETGTWAINGNILEQNDEVLNNTNIHASLNQNQADAYLYHWSGMMTGSGTNRRAGFHFMIDDPTQTNRGNSYFAWFRLDNDKVQIYKVVNDVFSLETDTAYDFIDGEWYDFKVVYNKVSGLIEVFVDNELAANWTDPSPYTNGSHISLRSGNATMQVDNLKAFKLHTGSMNVTVGSNEDLPYENANPNTSSGKVKSFAIDTARNISAEDQQLLNIDWTPPAAVSLVNDGDNTDIDVFYNNTEIRANWSTSTDPNSDIGRYWYAIGTSAGGTDVVNWTDNWSFDTLAQGGLSLTTGTTYYVSVIAENGAGLQSGPLSSDGQLLDIPSGPPVAGFIAGTTIICVGDSIQFTNNSQNAFTYSWDFPGGSPATSTLSSPKVLYASGGNYTVTLTATGPGGTDTEVQNISVSLSPAPMSDFTVSDTTLNLPSATANFNNTSQNSNAYYWDFGDGNTSTDINPWHTYTANGVYQVMLISLNDGCAADTSYATVYVGVSGLGEADEDQVYLFPNPANDLLKFNRMVLRTEVMDAAGKLILLETGVFNELSINQLAPGSYFIRLETTKGTHRTLRFTKL